MKVRFLSIFLFLLMIGVVQAQVSVTDSSLLIQNTAIFNTVYTSADGNDWTAIQLQGTTTRGNWILRQANANTDLTNARYIATYSCNWQGNWNCPDDWQITDRQAINTLVANGQPTADIIVSQDAPNMVKLAAEYFQNDIQEMSGAILPIVNSPSAEYSFHVYIGESEYTNNLGITSEGTEYDGYKIVSGPDYLVMLGDDKPYDVSREMTDAQWDAHTAPDVWSNTFSAWQQRHKVHDMYSRDGRGSMNAIHDFLHQQGIRYYYPTDFGTIIPQKDTITVDQISQVTNPAFAMRSPYMYYKRFGHLHNQGLFLDDGSFGTKEEWTRYQLSMRLNHEQKVVLGKVAHGLDAVTDREETRQAHPEYYAVWGTELMNTGHKPKQNLCSPELKAATIRYVSTMIDTYGDMFSGPTYVSLWPADGFTRVSDHSQECKDTATPEYGNDGRISDYVWNFINDVAWEIHDEYGEGHYIMGGAYSAYKLPPRNITNPRGFAPNLAVMIAHNRVTTASAEQKAYREQLVNEWDAIAPGQVFMNDKYLYNKFGSTSQSVPHFFPDIISEDFQFLDGKVNGEFDEVATNLPWRDTTHDAYAATGLNMYITSRLFWDPYEDVDALLAEYYDLYYGPAAQQMKEIVEYSQANLRNDFVTNPIHLDTMRDMAETALSQVPENSDYAKRINTLLGMMNAVYTGEEVTVQECQPLTSPGTTYVLNQPVSSADQCFFIDQNGITLDCKGFTIASDGDAVHISGRQTNRGNYYTIKNCDIDSQNGHGIYANNADNGLIENNNIEAGSRAIWVSASENVIVRDNYAYSPGGAAIYLQVGNTQGSDALTNHLAENNIFETDSGDGAAIYNPDGDIIQNNEFIANSGIALRMYNPENTLLANNIMRSISGTTLRIQTPGDNFTRVNNVELNE